MFEKWKDRRRAAKLVTLERHRLKRALDLAVVQWQYSQKHYDDEDRKQGFMKIAERRYMYLYRVAKQRNLHAGE